jgi:hypothetical protein
MSAFCFNSSRPIAAVLPASASWVTFNKFNGFQWISVDLKMGFVHEEEKKRRKRKGKEVLKV